MQNQFDCRFNKLSNTSSARNQRQNNVYESVKEINQSEVTMVVACFFSISSFQKTDKRHRLHFFSLLCWDHIAGFVNTLQEDHSLLTGLGIAADDCL